MPPILIQGYGCVGSTSVDRLLRDMLSSALGIKIYESVGSEWLKGKNRGVQITTGWRTPEEVNNTLRLAADRGEQVVTKLFKFHSLPDGGASIKAVFRDAGATSFIVNRANRIDYHCCRIRDCFHGGMGHAIGHAMGYPVIKWANESTGMVAGQNSTLCFSRRKWEREGNGIVGCHFNDIPNLIPNLLHHPRGSPQELVDQSIKDGLINPGDATNAIYTMEDLLAFTHNDPKSDGGSALRRSTASWTKLLQYLGFREASGKRIEQALTTLSQRRFHALLPHSTVVANVEDVRRAVEGGKPEWVRGMWRD